MKKLLLLSAIVVQAGLVSGAQAAGIEWNGFGSAYYGQALTQELLVPGLPDQYSNFSTPSNFGVNIGSKINETTSVAAQFVASSSDANGDWNLMTKWAFLTYRFTDSFSVKIGRQLIPALLAAEFSSVGYLMPMRTISPAMFALVPMTGFNGVSATYNNSGFSATIFGGRPNYDLPKSGAVSFSGGAKDLTGVALAYDGDGYGLRAHWNRSRPNLSVTAGGTTTSAAATVDTYTVGYRVDKKGFVSWGEYGYVKSSDGNTWPAAAGSLTSGGAYLNLIRAGYVLVGYKVGDFMPRYTYSHVDLETGIRNGKTDSHIVGVNYNVNPQVIAKLEYEMATTPGVTESGPGLATRAAGSTATSGNAVYAGVDFVF